MKGGGEPWREDPRGPIAWMAAASLLVAHLITGCGGDPATAPAPKAWFEDTLEASGVRFEHTNGHDERYLMPETITGGGALFDMDGDGDLDLYLVQGGRAAGEANTGAANALYENLGDGTFRDVTAASGTGDTGYGMGAACGDYDGDGDTDLYVTNLGPNVLYRNEGGGRFTDVTEAAGVGDPEWGTSTTFLDMDRDGDLDLFVCNYVNWSPAIEQACTTATGEADYCSPTTYQAPTRDVLFRNEGDGTFTDVSIEAGLGQAFGNGLGVGCADFDGDGWIDIFVANDQTLDQLWMNQGDGTFVDEAVFMGCAVDENGLAKAGMGVAIADIDADGDPDVIVCNIDAETDSLYLNQGDFFTDSTARLGLGIVSRSFTRFGMGWADFDNDGFLDLYQANGRVQRKDEAWSEDPYAEPNVLFRGSAGGFSEVQPRGGTRELAVGSSRAALFGDLDGDGGVDVVVVNQNLAPSILLNRVPERGHWLGLQLVDASGADALGARVHARVGGQERTAEVRAGYSFLASNDPRVHLGLGELASATEVTVTWPDGTVEGFGELAADRVHRLQRGTGH